jgi:excisionase family DNA binding protein
MDANILFEASRKGRAQMEITMPKLLRVEEVVLMTGWSKSKVYAMAASGDIPSLRTGRSVRIPLAALQRWIDKNTSGGEIHSDRVPSIYETRGLLSL